MIAIEEIPQLVQRMWLWHSGELLVFDNIHDYVKGERGFPHLPESADAEVKAIRDICIHNVLDLVVDAFVQNLAVVGYRNAQAEQDANGWDIWQHNKMDARQTEIYSSAVKYGVGYVVCIPGDDGQPMFRPRSPRQMMTIYNDPQIDDWPQYAVETWIDGTDTKARRKGIFFDDTHYWELDLGEVLPPPREQDEEIRRVQFTISEDSIGTPIPHNAGVCPVVRFVNKRDSEILLEGEIHHLLTDQRKLNEANFDRMIVARFGAFPQKVIAGWTGSTDEVLRASAKRVWTFDDDTVKTSSFPAAAIEPYNQFIQSLEQHIASRAQISPTYVAGGELSRVSPDAVAAMEANQQRKLQAMRLSHGESHEQLLGLALKMRGQSVDDGAEVSWRDTETRSFAVIADGIIKLAQAMQTGAPIEPLLPLVPGVTQQMIVAMKRQAQAAQVTQLLQQMRTNAQTAAQNPQVAALAGHTAPSEMRPTPPPAGGKSAPVERSLAANREFAAMAP